MIKNTISITASLVNGSQFELLTKTPPEVALAEYFCPDVYPKVQSLVIEAQTNEGKMVKLFISPGTIKALIE